jgi:hypothetical protein
MMLHRDSVAKFFCAKRVNYLPLFPLGFLPLGVGFFGGAGVIGTNMLGG